MSNTNGQVSFVKSMNGILSFNTGSGTIISGDTITTDNFNTTNFNCDNIQGIAPSDAISLYTNSTNTIHLANGATTLFLDAPTTIAIINTNIINSFDTALPSYLFPNALTDVSIADGLTTGILSMGSLLQVGEINIGGNNNFGGSINIGREMLNGIIRIASNCTNTSIYFGNDANSGTVNFNTNTTLNLGPYAKTINIGTKQFLATDIINIGNSLTGTAGININCKGTLGVGNNANIINIGTSMTTGPITIGTATVPIIGPYVCTSPTHLANKQYVDSIIPQSLLSLTNIWTGVSNTFNNTIIGNTITASAVGSTVNLFNNITTGSLNMATGITNGNILIGSHSTIGATGSLTLRAKNSVEIGSAAASIYLGIGSPSINIGNSIVGGTPTIDIGTAALSTININGKFGKAITPTYGYTAFVGTPAGCIGNFFAPSSAIAANFPLVPGVNKVGGIFANLPIGVWMLYWNCVVYCPTTVANLTSITLMMGTTSGGTDLFSGVVDIGNVAVGITKTYLITQIYSNIAATTDLYFSITAVFTGTLTLLPLYATKDCKVLRIA